MRCYVIEDLYPEHLQKLTAALTEKGFAGSLDGIYYLPLPEELLTETQREHAAECGPHICVLEVLEEGALKLELLVRAQNKLRCECVFYATEPQRQYIITFLDDFIRQMDISV